MDEVDSLIADYRTEVKDRSGMLESLLPHFGDRRVLELLRDVAANPAEDASARILALREFTHFRPKSVADQQVLARLYLDRVVKDHNQMVREYSAVALANYGIWKEVQDVLIPLLEDPQEDANVRRAAFYSIVRTGSWIDREPLVRAMLGDAVLAEDAQRVLKLRR